MVISLIDENGECGKKFMLQRRLSLSFRFLRWSREAYERKHLNSLLINVLAVKNPDVKIAIQLLKAHKTIKCREAIHAAVMISNNISTILSADSHFDCIDVIKRIDPLEFEV